MSSLYSQPRPRPRTPPSPPPLSHRSSNSRNSRQTLKGYEEPSKSYSSKDYGKYSSYNKYDKSDRTKYDKSEKYDSVLDYKLDKPSYKSSSYLSSKEYRRDYSPPSLLKGSSNHGEKYRSGKDSYPDDSYKSRRNHYSESGYSDKSLYASKFSSSTSDKYSKYSPERKDILDSKYSGHSSRGNLTNSGADKKYSYPDSKSMSYSKYVPENDSYYDKKEGLYDCYDSYRRGSSQDHSGKRRGGDSRMDYSDSQLRGGSKSRSDVNDSFKSSTGGGYQRYVIGDSVVYGSPGHYPKDIYPPSPKIKRARSPHSPPPPLLSSKLGNSKKFSRYSSSPPRYSSSNKRENSIRDQPYSKSNSSYRSRPLSPDHSYEGINSHRNDHSSRNYPPPLMRNKSFDGDKDRRHYNQRDSNLGNTNMRSHNTGLSGDYNTYNRGKDETYSKSSCSYQGNSGRGVGGVHQPKDLSDRVPRREAPRPLLSIPINMGSLPINGIEKLGRQRRLEGRTMRGSKRALSPKDKRKRRPDDLRLWIESRKTNVSSLSGNKSKGPIKRPLRGNEGGNRSRLMDSRRRILSKGKRKGGGAPLRGMKKGKRLLPSTAKSNSSANNKTKDSKRDDARNSSSVGNRNRHGTEGSKAGKDKPKGNNTRDRRVDGGNRSSGRNAVGGSSSSNKKPLKRNRLNLKQRSGTKRTAAPRSPQERERDKHSYSNDKNHQTKSKARDTNSRTYSRPRPRSLTRSRSRSKPRQRSRSRSPRRNDKAESSSFSRH